MYQRFIASSRKCFSIFSSFESKSIHSNCKHFTNQLSWPLKIESALASHLGSSLEACADRSVLQQGRKVHAQFIVNGISNNAALGAKILGMYALCGSFIDASNMFFRLELGASLPWNRMIRVFVKMGLFRFALLFYFKMLSCGVLPDNHTFPSVMKACSALNSVRLGKLVHDMILSLGCEFDVFVGSALVKFYAENRFIDEARYLFDKMSQRDCVLWNVMMNGSATCGKSGDVIRTFKEMRISETKPNSVTCACILSVCAAEAMIDFGTQVHCFVVSCGLEMDPQVANSLLSVYSKCGQVYDARRLFELMPQIDLVTWNGMISGHVQTGFMNEALDLLRDMIFSGVKPNEITFSSFLPSIAEMACLKQGM